MDKLLCTLGMGLVVVFFKMRIWLDGFAASIKGGDGFLMVMAVCLCGLLCAGAIFWKSGTKKQKRTA